MSFIERGHWEGPRLGDKDHEFGFQLVSLQCFEISKLRDHVGHWTCRTMAQERGRAGRQKFMSQLGTGSH